MRILPILLAILLAPALGQTGTRPALPAGAEAWSLSGEALYPPPLTPEKRAKFEKQLEEARAMQPGDSADRAIWIGRRLAYLGRFRDAIEAFSAGIAKHPEDPRLYRHRGHRYITTRQFDLAKADLERAASLIAGKPDEVEPDGQPNPKGGPPVGSLHANTWYHLGLVYYLTRDYPNALRGYRECMKSADNPDRLCSTSYWLYLTLRRLGRDDEAKKLLEPIRADMELVESQSYHKLLLVFRGDRKPDEVLETARKDADPIPFPTIAYGLGAWASLNGDARPDRAALFREMRASGNWHAFGVIAAESERWLDAKAGTPESR